MAIIIQQNGKQFAIEVQPMTTNHMTDEQREELRFLADVRPAVDRLMDACAELDAARRRIEELERERDELRGTLAMTARNIDGAYEDLRAELQSERDEAREEVVVLRRELVYIAWCASHTPEDQHQDGTGEHCGPCWARNALGACKDGQ